MSQQPPKRRKPKGSALDWDDADLDRLARVTPDDVAEAREWWHATAPRRYRALLDSGSDDERVCRDAIDAVIVRSNAAATALAERLRSRAMTVESWQIAMASEVRLLHLCAVAAGRGGWSRVTLADLEE